MKHLAVYMMFKLGGKDPTVEDITQALDVVGIEADSESLTRMLNELEGKDMDELMALGRVSLAKFGSGGGGGGGGAAAAAVEETKEEEKKEEEEEEEIDMGGGMDMFGGDDDGGETAQAPGYGYEACQAYHEKTYFPEDSEFYMTFLGPLNFVDPKGNTVALVTWNVAQAAWEAAVNQA